MISFLEPGHKFACFFDHTDTLVTQRAAIHDFRNIPFQNVKISTANCRFSYSNDRI